MKFNANVSIHNRFDIEVRDAITGELKQEAKAYNLVLDKMYTQLCAGAVYFVYINFGTGTGTLSPTRTALFTYLGTKVAVDDTIIKAVPTSSWKRKIILNPEEYVGSIITEVGISFSSGTAGIVTHALLEDSEGNIISITKSATDVITIYATVYVTVSCSIPEMSLLNLPNNNQLINYLIGGGGSPTGQFSVGACDYPSSPQTIGLGSRPSLGTSPNISWTSDVVNKKRIANLSRFGTTVGTGHITEIMLSNLFRVVLPIAGVIAAQPYTGVSIGTGDGLTKDFILPSKNVNQNSVSIKVNDVIEVSITKTLISTEFNFALNNPLPGVSNVTTGCSLSSDGLILAIAQNGIPYVTTYDLTGGAWIKRSDPSILPSSAGVGCSLSSDGLILAVGSDATPFITTYDWIVDAWIKRSNPSILPTGTGRGCSLSSDGLILAVAHSVTPFITTYDWTGGAWIKRADPSTLPPNTSLSCSLSSDGLTLAVIHTTTPFITTYDWIVDAWIKRSNPSILPSSGGTGCSLSSDGLILAVGSGATPYIIIYDWTGGAWIKRSNPSTLPSGGGVGCSFASDGLILAVAHSGAPNITTYDLKNRQTQISFTTAPTLGQAITADYTVNGIHKTDQYVIDVGFSIQFGEG